MFRCLCCWFPGWGVFHQKTSAGVEELGEGAEPWPSLLAGTWIHTDAFDCSPNSSNQTGQTFACSCFCMMVLTWIKNETQKMWIFDPITSDLKYFIISVFLLSSSWKGLLPTVKYLFQPCFLLWPDEVSLMLFFNVLLHLLTCSLSKSCALKLPAHSWTVPEEKESCQVSWWMTESPTGAAALQCVLLHFNHVRD